jgi:tetratricopeptide (TPR) repeat protein
MRRCWVALALLTVATGAKAQTAERSSLAEIFEAANVAASRGDYASAVSGYRSLLDAGVRDSDVYFNLGTVHAQSGDYPRAILNFERSLVVRPSDEKTEENLHEAERALEELRAEAEGEATIQRSESIGDALYGGVTEDALAYALLLANLCFFGCLAWAWLVRRRGTWLIAISTTAGVLLVLSALGLGVKAGMLRDGPRAVALDDRVAVREGPDQRAKVRGEVRGGDRVQVVATDRDFVKLRVVRGLEGWAPASSVGLVDLGQGLH